MRELLDANGKMLAIKRNDGSLFVANTKGDGPALASLAFQIQEDRDRLAAENAALREIVAEMANAGVEWDVPTCSYITLQVPRAAYASARAAAGEE